MDPHKTGTFRKITDKTDTTSTLLHNMVLINVIHKTQEIEEHLLPIHNLMIIQTPRYSDEAQQKN